MPRYLVERTFPDGLAISQTREGAAACQTVVDGNMQHQVTWVHSYVSPDRTRTFCLRSWTGAFLLAPVRARRRSSSNDFPFRFRFA